jgi:hypothetical protein
VVAAGTTAAAAVDMGQGYSTRNFLAAATPRTMSTASSSSFFMS